MNKGFLSKKSWHTGSLRSVEKVWKAERANDEEQKKIEVLKKEMAEEQQIYDLKKLHQEATGKRVERLDWMYDGNVVASGAGRTTAEEYLLGKKYEGDKEQEELGKLKTTVGSLFMGVVNPAQDAAAKMRDDPLLAIKRQEQKSLNDILQNPVIMNDIRKEKEYKELLKRMKKDKKRKDKKDKKRSTEEGRQGDAEADSPKRRRMDEDSRRSEHRDSGRDNKDSGRDNRDYGRDNRDHGRGNRENGRDDKDSARDNREARHDKDRDYDRRDREEDRRDRDRSDKDREHKATDKEKDQKEHRDREGRDRDRDRRDTSDRERRDRDDKERGREREEKGRQDSREPEIKKEDTTSKPAIGASGARSAARPQWKRESKWRQPIDESEKQKRLQEMMQDAQTHEEDRWTRLKREKAEEAEETKHLHTADRNFIDDVNKNIYDTNAPTIEERMKRNVHYIQRRAVDDKFLK